MEQKALEALIEKVADWVVAAERVVVFTGAGVSTESGIPDFRGPDGVWTRFNPNDFTYQKFLSDPEMRKRTWERFKDGNSQMLNAQPNAAHLAIAELEKIGKLDCLITQNIDDLHRRAGNSPEKILELHGNSTYVKCLDCGKRYAREYIREKMVREDISIPSCESCGGMLKSGTVSFGEPMPERETQEASRRSQMADVFIVVGSSLVVYPAAYMPIYAVEAGAKLAIINVSETALDGQADLIINAKAGEVMTLLVDKVKQKMGV